MYIYSAKESEGHKNPERRNGKGRQWIEKKSGKRRGKSEEQREEQESGREGERCREDGKKVNGEGVQEKEQRRAGRIWRRNNSVRKARDEKNYSVIKTKKRKRC